MSSKFASGKFAVAECDRCGFKYKLKQLKTLTIRGKKINLLVCASCWEADHPQNSLGRFPVNDYQAIKNPRPDLGREESRSIQWGWNPVGFSNPFNLPGLRDSLEARSELGSVTVVTEESP